MEDEASKAFRVIASTKKEEWIILRDIDKLIQAPYDIKTKILMSHSLMDYFINEVLIKLERKKDTNKPLLVKLDIIKESVGLRTQSYYNIKRIDKIRDIIEKNKSMSIKELNKSISMLEFRNDLARRMYEKEDGVNNLIMILRDILWELKRAV